jgi:hypothetical protein
VSQDELQSIIENWRSDSEFKNDGYKVIINNCRRFTIALSELLTQNGDGGQYGS